MSYDDMRKLRRKAADNNVEAKKQEVERLKNLCSDEVLPEFLSKVTEIKKPVAKSLCNVYVTNAKENLKQSILDKKEVYKQTQKPKKTRI